MQTVFREPVMENFAMDSLLSFWIFVGQSRRTSFASYRACSNYFNSESWSRSTNPKFSKFSFMFLLDFICHAKILKALNQTIIVFELLEAGYLRGWFRICRTRSYLDDPFGIFKMLRQPSCLHLVCTWRERKFRKFSAGTRFASDPKFFR